MSFFKLTNDKKFNIENIKSGIKIDKDNEFLKKYDANQNSIFDFDELNKFKEDLKPYTDDGKIDSEEYTDWYAKVMGITVDAVKQLFKTGDKNGIEELFNSSFNSLEEGEAHRECIDIIRNTALKANTDMMLEDKGSVIKLIDKLSNFFHGRLSENQIYKIIFEELMTAEFLDDAEKGELTKSEYIERKIENTKALCMAKIMKENLEDVKKWTKEHGITNWNEEKFVRYMDAYLTSNLRNVVKQAAEDADGNIDFEAAAKSINLWVDHVLSMDEEKSKEFFANICTKACEEYQELHLNDWGTDGKHIQIGGNDSLSFDDTEKLTFNQVFKLERGEDFSVENFNAYKEAESNMQFVSSAYNKLSLTLSDIDGIMQEYKNARINHEELGNDFEYTSLTPNAQKRIPNIIQMFAKYYMGDAELASQDLNKMIKDKDIVAGLKIISNDDGSLSIEFDESLDNDTKRNDALNNLLEIFKSEISKRFENILGGKKLEDYAKEYTTARDNAIGGTDLDAIIQAYQGKNATIIDQIAGAAQTGGMVLIVAGGALCLTPLAATGVPEAMTALGGNVVIGTMALEYEAKYLEMFTKDEINDEELQNLNKHFIMDAGGMIVGIKAGKMGNKVFGKMLDKNLAKVLKKPLSEVNRIKDFKAIAKSPEQLKNLMQAFGGKVSTDFLISYAGDLAMMGALGGVEGEDWMTLLRANLMGLAIGTTSDLADLGNVGMRRERLKELRDKQAKGIQLDTKEIKELAALEKEFADIDKPEMGLTEKPESISTSQNAGLIDDVNRYIDGLLKDGNNFEPKFDESTNPLLKEYFEYTKAENERLAKLGIKVKQPSKMGILKGLEDFIRTKSEFATREDYIKITDEIAKLMPEYIKEKYPNVRPEIAENADKIYKWKAAMSGQTQPGKPDENGNYPITNDKFFDNDAHDKAVKEFTTFLEEMTGKKVLVGNSVRFDEFINMMGCFNNPDFYKDVDYIVLGHGTGSSLITDTSDPNAWRFKGDGTPVWQYLSENIPEGKKALLLVCEHDGKTLTDRKNMPEMYDDNGVYMKGIGDVANGIKEPAKIVVGGINHIVGAVESKYKGGPVELITGGLGGEVTVTKYSVNNISKRIDLNKTSYETYTDKDGNKIYKVVATATPNEKHGGYDFTYDVYKVDNDGNIIDELNGVTDKEIKEQFGEFKNRQIHDNSSTDNSGYAYSGIPFFRKVWNAITEKTEVDKEPSNRRKTNLDSNTPSVRMDISRYPAEINRMIDEACRELNYDRDSFYAMVLKDVEPNSIIFRNKETLKEYLVHCFNMSKLTDDNGQYIFKKKVYDNSTNQIKQDWDNDLIKDVATLMVTDERMHESLGNLVGMFMDGDIDEFSFRTMVHYVKKGYLSPGTVNIALQSLYTTDGKKNIGMYYIEFLADVTHNKTNISHRQNIITQLKNSNPEVKNAIENLHQEIGDEIYNLRWECINGQDTDFQTVLDFVKDAKNLLFINKTMLIPETFKIKIPGYGSNHIWMHDVPEIANVATAMLDEGNSFDDVINFIALLYRELDLKTVKPGQDKGKYTNSGVLRCEREGYYHEKSGFDGDGVHTLFGYTDRYGICYADKFKKVAYPNQLMIPNGYNIGLTRIEYFEQEIDLGEYSQNIQPIEISYEEYKYRLQNNENVSVGIDKTNGKKHYYRENDEKNYVTERKDIYGNMHYYKIKGNMMHPNGKYVNNALDIVHSIQDMLMDKYHGKDLTEADMADINESIGEIHWILSHSMPWGRGSAGISDAYVKALYKSLGIQISQPKAGISFDLEAFCTELEDYKKNYKYLYEREPKYVK